MAHEESFAETSTFEVKDEGERWKTCSPRDGNRRINKEDEQLESTKVEMGEAKEENKRLKKMLDKIENDYQSLQMHFFDILQRDPPLKPKDTRETNELEHPEISLCLGKSTQVESKISNENTNRSAKPSEDGLTLGLDLRCLSETSKSEMETEDSSPEIQELKEDELGESWPPSKALKTPRRESKEASETSVAKRARVSIRARCETPTMLDGCQWRKYGQKTAKGNPCPRAYYRCTIAPSCPVRKQVQRCPEDMSILITTYEGTHNHPLPVAATSMASTTAAAASMLMSRSSTSPGLGSATAPASATTANINGLNFTFFDTSRTRPFNFPTASSLTPPTITLDLTTNPTNRFSQAPRFSSTSLDFSSSSEPIKLATPWGGGGSNYLNYLPSLQYNKPPIGTLDFAKQPNGLSSTGLVTSPQSSSSSQQFLTETIAKVITAAPSFQHAVAAAISNMVGSGNFTNSWHATGNGDQNQSPGFPSVNNTSPQTGKVCFTSYLSNPPQSASTPMPMSSSASAGSFAFHQLGLSKGSSSIAAPSIDANNNQQLKPV